MTPLFATCLRFWRNFRLHPKFTKATKWPKAQNTAISSISRIYIYIYVICMCMFHMNLNESSTYENISKDMEQNMEKTKLLTRNHRRTISVKIWPLDAIPWCFMLPNEQQKHQMSHENQIKKTRRIPSHFCTWLVKYVFLNFPQVYAKLRCFLNHAKNNFTGSSHHSPPNRKSKQMICVQTSFHFRLHSYQFQSIIYLFFLGGVYI